MTAETVIFFFSFSLIVGGVAGGRVGHQGLAAGLPYRCCLVRGKTPKTKVILSVNSTFICILNDSLTRTARCVAMLVSRIGNGMSY